MSPVWLIMFQLFVSCPGRIGLKYISHVCRKNLIKTAWMKRAWWCNRNQFISSLLSCFYISAVPHSAHYLSSSLKLLSSGRNVILKNRRTNQRKWQRPTHLDINWLLTEASAQSNFQRKNKKNVTVTCRRVSSSSQTQRTTEEEKLMLSSELASNLIWLRVSF